MAASIGTASPRPTPATAVLMPTTRPRESASAPPELPGLSAASVWMTFSTRRLVRPSRVPSDRPSAETTPAVTVPANPSGFPMATTSWPTLSRAASPSGAGGGLPPVVRMTARSDSGSRPTTSNGSSSPSTNVAVPRSAPGDDVGRGQEVADGLDGDRRTGTARRPAADLARDAQAGDRRDEPLGRGRDRDRVGVEQIVVVDASSGTDDEVRAEAPARASGQASPVAVVPPPTWTVRSSVPRTTLTSNGSSSAPSAA